ncbi:MAG: hypothetical protein Q9182_006839 [Xanthomendoza sp. 2 TL-2023]
MAPDSGANLSRPGLSLYANLVDPKGTNSSAPGTISRAPIVFKQPDGGAESVGGDISAQRQQASAAPLRFQPTKRPQLSTQKAKPKSTLQKSGPPNVGADAPKVAFSADPISTIQPPVKTTLSDWAAVLEDEDGHGLHAAEKRQRGGRKKRKKNKDVQVLQNWDDIYDPSRPNSYEEYQNSDEKFMEIREWKDRLYAHRISRRRGNSEDSTSDNGQRTHQNLPTTSRNLSFAPPTDFGSNNPTTLSATDMSGDDAYMQRSTLCRTTIDPAYEAINDRKELALPQSARFQNSSPSSSDHQAGRNMQVAAPNVTRAPVRYNLPLPPPDLPSSEAELADALDKGGSELEETKTDEAPRSLRPGQKGFAERLMSKYGWTKGLGLGVSGSGIVKPLRVQVEKQKKKPDSEGGGFVGPGGKGKIIGGRRAAASRSDTEPGMFGTMSEVIVLRGMVDGLDLDVEMEWAEDGGLLQEIGDECGQKYGRVERVFIDRSNLGAEHDNARVYVKFTSQLSALRAVNALEGRIFNGNAIKAKFYDCEKFDSGVYDPI